MALKDIKQIKNVSWGTAGSVVVGIAAFGLLMYGIRRLPENSITTPVKSAASVVNG